MKPTYVAGDTTPPWRARGLFSDHFLSQRLPGSALWPDAATTDRAFAAATELLDRNVVGLRRGNEEDCEDRFVSPMLQLLGFGFGNRRAIPFVTGRFLPDYLLYADPALADAAFHSGARDGFYADALGILEAKRWGHNLSEDASGTGKAARGRSPHHQIRDYLAETDRLAWGILTNGARWRLYCKHDRASSYFEFDLEAALSLPDRDAAREHLRLFLALFRRAAFERGPDGRSPLDAIRDGASRFREEVERRLRAQVFDCVEILGQGFVDNAENDLGAPDLPDVFAHSLILLYRLLFVLNAEARDLLPTRATNEGSRAYVQSYGLELVRQKLGAPDTAAEYADDGTFGLHERLQALFRLINGRSGSGERRDKNEALGVPRYNGGLFDPERFPFLEHKRVADAYLSRVLTLLSYRTDPDGSRSAFDYAGLGERHLGSIYEGLLEHRFVIDPVEATAPVPGTALAGVAVRLANDKGERKTLGAYYTPQPWVDYIVEHTLAPLLDRANAEVRASLDAAGTDPDSQPLDDSFAEAVLRLNICDPAMGSGHFLVAAVDLLSEAVAAHPTTASRPELTADGRARLKSDGSGEVLCTQEAKLSHWKRRIAESCVYGVDLNPLAVELAKLSVWLKTVSRTPLGFLDHHLRCGDSLLGTWLDRLPQVAAPGRRAVPDPRLTAASPGPAGRPARDKRGQVVAHQLPLTFAHDLATSLAAAIADIAAIEGVSTDTLDAAREKERRWREIADRIMPPYRHVADLWLAPWFGVDLDQDTYARAIDLPAEAERLRAAHAAVLDPLRPFHWELEFPDVFFDADGHRRPDAGFDAVVGNPPWERIKLQENEFFAARSQAIAHAPRASDRKRLIAELPRTDPVLWRDYEAIRARKEQVLGFVQRSGLFPLMGRGDTNTYAVFAERALDLVAPHGRTGLLVPSGIATDATTQHFFQRLVEQQGLVELLDFENRRKVFEDVDSRFKFSVILMSGHDAPQTEVRCGFFLHGMDALDDPERTFTLAPSDFRLFNPNTLTCPIFRRRRDAELTRKIYERVPVLVDKAQGAAGNPWGIRFATMFHMTNDSHLFRTAAELEGDGFWLGAGNVYGRGGERYVPLYEAKMIHQFDHRYAGGVASDERLISTQASEVTTSAQKQDPDFVPLPRFWVPASTIPTGPGFWLGYRDIARATDVRTCIASVFPPVGAGNTIALVQTTAGPRMTVCLYANLCSLGLDYAARQKVSTTHLNFFIVEQFPVLPPSAYDADWHGVRVADFIRDRVLELCYTAHDLKGFADGLGYDGPPFAWDVERRLHLRSQLDALFFHLYGLTRDETIEILDTFPIVRRADEARYGRFRTRDLVVGYYNAYAAGDLGAWVKG
jgi:hypothetical protein